MLLCIVCKFFSTMTLRRHQWMAYCRRALLHVHFAFVFLSRQKRLVIKTFACDAEICVSSIFPGYDISGRAKNVVSSNPIAVWNLLAPGVWCDDDFWLLFIACFSAGHVTDCARFSSAFPKRVAPAADLALQFPRNQSHRGSLFRIYT